MLPIHEALPRLKLALQAREAAVLVAPPGAGKTTVVPLELVREPWAQGARIIMLEPRRLAARAAAERMAQTLGETPGQSVGFRIRGQSKVSSRTRVEVVTEGVFTRMILDDPGLEGVAAVVFDEFHERSLDADLGLALARDSQTLLRPELRILVMSATLDGARISALLGEAPVVESQGRSFPVDTRYLGRDGRLTMEDQTARAVRKALSEEAGGVLVFLPGQGEIRRVAERLGDQISDPAVDVVQLYGALEGRDQRRAIAPAEPGRRKVVLATTIAQTSLTLEGVRVVIDAGLSRVPRFDPSSALTRLVTVKVSRASADQRRGRAGRTEPGVCYRLWDEAETRALQAFDRPEILEADLSRLALDLARWGARDTAGLALLDTPPRAALQEARDLLGRIEALKPDGGLTDHGLAISKLGLAPRLAHMIIRGAEQGAALRAARIAALLAETKVGGGDTDLTHRLQVLDRDTGFAAREAKLLADRWAQSVAGRDSTSPSKLTDGLLVAEAYPERIARARGEPGEFILASGRGAFLPPTDALAREPWLAVAELRGGGPRDRITLAAPVSEGELRQAFHERISEEEVVDLDARGRVQVRRLKRLGAIVLEERSVDHPSQAVFARALLGQVRRQGLAALAWGEDSPSLRARLSLLREVDDQFPDLSDDRLLETLDEWFAPLLEGRRALEEVAPHRLHEALLNHIPWDVRQTLDRLAPSHWQAPTGSRLPVDYQSEGGPTVSVRVQELFGLNQHPTILGGRLPLTLSLLSPARRPIQVTRDLPGFWAGSWKDVRAEMRGRYPRHVWPEDPAAAAPTTRAKPRA
jgi:ATP-dependent helicase HrpB